MASKSRKKTKRGIVLPDSLSLDTNEQAGFEKEVLKIKQKGKGAGLTPGVVYIGHIPHGFHEPEMKKFFSQFGTINKLRISRSKKTGHIKGYGFIEFQCDEVAKIVADTMNNYLMFERLLKCQYMPAAKVHPDLFKGSKRLFCKPKSHLLAIQRHNSEKTDKQMVRHKQIMLGKYKKKMAKLAELGINYQLDSMAKEVKEEVKNRQGTLKQPAEKSVKNMKEFTKLITDNVTPVKSKGSSEELAVDKAYMLLEDSTDEEILFKTPPNTVKSSTLPSPMSVGMSARKRKLTSTPLHVKSLTAHTPKKGTRGSVTLEKSTEKKQIKVKPGSDDVSLIQFEMIDSPTSGAGAHDTQKKRRKPAPGVRAKLDRLVKMNPSSSAKGTRK